MNDKIDRFQEQTRPYLLTVTFRSGRAGDNFVAAVESLVEGLKELGI